MSSPLSDIESEEEEKPVFIPSNMTPLIKKEFNSEDPSCHVQNSSQGPSILSQLLMAKTQLDASKRAKCLELSEKSCEESPEFEDLDEKPCILLPTQAVTAQELPGFDPLSSEGGFEPVFRRGVDCDSDIVFSDESDPDLDEKPGTVATAKAETFHWSNHRPDQIPDIPFTSERTLKIPPASETPGDYFRLLFPDEIVDEIVLETNKYAMIFTDWKPLTRDEFLVFLGVTFHTGTFQMERIADYWTPKSVFGGLLHIPCFAQIMTRSRYLMILECLHFVTNPSCNDPRPTDRLYKARLLLNFFNTRMNDVFSPGVDLCIGSLDLWNLYGQGVQNKYGMKLYILTEPSGVALKVVLKSGIGHSNEIVNALLEGYKGKGHRLFMDSFHNSPKLTRELKEHKILVTGTLKPSKYMPKDVTSAKLKKGEMVQAFSNDGICVMKWKGHKEVFMISSVFSGDLVRTKPEMFLEYKRSTRTGSHLLSYPCVEKSTKRYKKLAIHLFHMMLINSFGLFNLNECKKSWVDFRLDVIESLVFRDYPDRPANIPRSFDHFPTLTEQASSSTSRGAQAKRLQLDCRLCKTKYNKRIRSSYYCRGCSDGRQKVGLCPGCFKEYHNPQL